MTSDYRLIRQAVIGRRRIVATYGGHRRELCPYVVGHTAGHERALVLQVGGTSSSGLEPGGAWRCLRIEQLADLAVSIGPWQWAVDYSADGQNCVADIDVAVR